MIKNNKFNYKKKILLILYPYKFREFDYFKNELSYLKKKSDLEIIIHDLSLILNSKSINNSWMSKESLDAIRFSSLVKWIFSLIKIRNKYKNILIYNFIECRNFSSFVIYFFLKILNFPLLIAISPQVAEKKIKKTINYTMLKIFTNFFNYKFIYFYINFYIFSFLKKFIYFKNVILLKIGSVKENLFLYGNTSYISFNSLDFSNNLLLGKKKKKLNKKYILYLDTPEPYFKDDMHIIGAHKKEKIDNWYKDLISFFLDLEKFFSAKVIIIPHHKNKGTVNPYFNNFEINHDNDAVIKLSNNCQFLISKGSTALSCAIINYKPIIFIYSSWYNFNRSYIANLFYQAKLIGTKPVNIENYSNKEILGNLKVSKRKYEDYKYKYLTNKNMKNRPNHIIIGDIIKNFFK